MASNKKPSTDKSLSLELRVALVGLHAVELSLDTLTSDLGRQLQSTLSPVFVDAVAGVLSVGRCPYGNPPVDLVSDFDSQRNRYVHCVHTPQHCWNLVGQYIPCP